MPPNLPLPKTADGTLPEIIALCQKVAPGQKAVYLEIEPVEEAIVNECYGNVDKAIHKSGGSIQYGWQIWETMPDVMAEAEFHAVWKDTDGNLHDVTPKEMPGITRILFLPDPTRNYSGRQIDNIRIALKDDPLVHSFITNAESYFEVTNRGELADYHGEIDLTPEMKDLMRKNAELFLAIVQKYY
ncbi:MAG: zinc chelation protein SecC [bacterium]|nr:zinc chelation protein SecC [bacterium]